MSKYGDLIKEARKTETSAKPNKTTEVKSSAKQDKKNSIILENNKTESIDQAKEEKLAGISIKVTENLRRHWVVESKRTGKSMTSVIINALTKEFGTPD